MRTTMEGHRLATAPFVLLVLAAAWTVAEGKQGCEVCKKMTDKVAHEMEATKGRSSGSGNSKWEEERGIKWDTSEARLAEIMEHACGFGKSAESKCLDFMEDGEEHVERWWHMRKKGFPKGNVSLYDYVCIRKSKTCCNEGFFGKNCAECPGGHTTPCSNHGSCQGSGDRKGKGKCKCDAGYIGKRCAKCGGAFYKKGLIAEPEEGGLAFTCDGCDVACAKGCEGPGAALCKACKKGYSRAASGEACADVDECASEELHNCTGATHCTNTDGGYTCSGCNTACHPDKGCTGPGADTCTDGMCAIGYILNTETQACEDIDECQNSNTCPVESFCTNTPGSRDCAACDPACESTAGCTGSGPEGCKACGTGWKMPDGKEAGCEDLDECATAESCAERMTCTNTKGSFMCNCVEPRTLVDGKCVAHSAEKKDEL